MLCCDQLDQKNKIISKILKYIFFSKHSDLSLSSKSVTHQIRSMYCASFTFTLIEKWSFLMTFDYVPYINVFKRLKHNYY